MKKLVVLSLAFLLTAMVSLAQTAFDAAMVPNADLFICANGEKINAAEFTRQSIAYWLSLKPEEWQAPNKKDDDAVKVMKAADKFVKAIGLTPQDTGFKRILGTIAFNNITNFDDDDCLEKIDCIFACEFTKPLNIANIVPALKEFFAAIVEEKDDLKDIAIAAQVVQGLPGIAIAIKDDDFSNGQLKLLAAFLNPSTFIIGHERSVNAACTRIKANTKPALDPFLSQVAKHDAAIALRMTAALKPSLQELTVIIPALAKLNSAQGFAFTTDVAQDCTLALRVYLPAPADAVTLKTELWDQQMAPFVTLMAAGLKPDFNNNLPCVDTIKGIADQNQFIISTKFSITDVKSIMDKIKAEALKPKLDDDDDDDDD